MDLTVDIEEIPVPPEYPVSEIYSTETYHLNRTQVRLLEEVKTKGVTVEQFLKQTGQGTVTVAGAKGVNGVGEGIEASRGHSPDAIEKRAGSRSTQIDDLASFTITRPSQSSAELTLNEDLFAVYFQQGESLLDQKANAVIENLPANQCFRVAGYASPEGGEWMNWELSKDRAETVVNAIEDSGGRVVGVGAFGEFASEIWPEPWPEQRRVEIYLSDCDVESQ